MRVCRAVVTEISYNYPNVDTYRAIIEFVSQAEWRRELNLLLSDVEGAAGSIHNEESESGIAYSEIKAVYPGITPQKLAKVNVEQLMQEKTVAQFLGCDLELEEESALALYNSMKKFIDSKEKTPNSQAGTDAEIESWPMIRTGQNLYQSTGTRHRLRPCRLAWCRRQQCRLCRGCQKVHPELCCTMGCSTNHRSRGR